MSNSYLITFLAVALLYFVYKYTNTVLKLKDEREYFIQTLSHDIRVALIAQINGLDLLQKSNIPINSPILEEINNSCKYTLDMVSMLINTYKHKSGDTFLNPESLNISAILYDVCRKFIDIAEKKGIEFHYEIEQSNIWADKTYITKAMGIIISLILERAEKESLVRFSIKQFKENVRLEIKYRGCNLTEEEFRKMFSKKPIYSTVGHGIKMHFCKKIIDFHSGKILVINNSKNDNSFIITIPSAKTKENLAKCLYSKAMEA